MASDMVKLLCCFDGRLVVAEDDMMPKYVSGTQRPIKVERSCTLEGLKGKVFQSTGIDPLEYSLLLTCKYPIHGGTYRAVALTNDEIVDCMLDESSVGGTIELYVEKENIARQTGVHTNFNPSAAMTAERVEPPGDMLIDKPDGSDLTQADRCGVGGRSFSYQAATDPIDVSCSAHQTGPSLIRKESTKESITCIPEVTATKTEEIITPPSAQNAHSNSSSSENGLPRQCYHMMSMSHWPLTHPTMMDQLNQAGFLVASSLQRVHIDMHLLCALWERWHPETNTFRIQNAEITITLQDVSVLTGLVVDGLPVITARAIGGPESRWAAWTDCCQELLGRVPRDTTVKTGKLKLSWLRDTFKDVKEGASPKTVAFHTRAYIMHMIGSWVVPNRSGNAVPCQYLPLLEDFEKCGRTAFGAASLAHLYRELGNASRDTIKSLAGNIHLLQLWTWERLKVGRPIMQEVDCGGYRYPGPLGIRWQGERRQGRPIGHLMFYRRELDIVGDGCVIWEPYPKSLLDQLPAICTSGKGVWQSRVPLIHFAIVEMHVPDRAMRQFGMQQHLAEDVAPVERIDARGKPGINWLAHHHAHITKWGQRHQLVVTERKIEDCAAHSTENHDPDARNIQGHMEQDLVNLCCHLRTRLNEHLLDCTKPRLVYEMLVDIDRTFGLHGLHHNTKPSSPSSKASTGLRLSSHRPSMPSSSSQLPLRPQARQPHSPLPEEAKGGESHNACKLRGRKRGF